MNPNKSWELIAIVGFRKIHSNLCVLIWRLLALNFKAISQVVGLFVCPGTGYNMRY